MADNLTKRGGRDRDRIDVGQDHELRHWFGKLGVSEEALEEAVQVVGTEASKVEQHLRIRGGEKGSRQAGERS